MPSDARLSPSNDVPLREHVERIFSERQAALDLAFRSQQELVRAAAEAMEKRLDKLNELREEVSQDRANFVTVDRFEGVISGAVNERERLAQRIGSLENWKAKATGAAVVLVLFAAAVGAAVAKALGS